MARGAYQEYRPERMQLLVRRGMASGSNAMMLRMRVPGSRSTLTVPPKRRMGIRTFLNGSVGWIESANWAGEALAV